MKKAVLIAVVAMAVALLGACDMFWFGELDAKTFSTFNEESISLWPVSDAEITVRQTATVEFIDDTTGRYSLISEVMSDDPSLDDMIGDVNEDPIELTFTYEWDFNTLEGTITPDDTAYSANGFTIDSGKQPMELQMTLYDTESTSRTWTLPEVVEEDPAE